MLIFNFHFTSIGFIVKSYKYNIIKIHFLLIINSNLMYKSYLITENINTVLPCKNFLDPPLDLAISRSFF